jgi:hypothetical protein
MKINQLDNYEISLVYYQFEKHFKDMNQQLDKGLIGEKITVDMPEEGGPPVMPVIVALEKISSDEVAAVRSSHYYQSIKSLLDKLSPIVEMIEEAEPNIKQELDE